MAPGQPDPGDRALPQDLAAEQGVLGGMLLSKDAIADVIDTIKGRDFYKPAHELIYDSILDLYGRGEPADAVTVANQLNKHGELARIGGAAYLHTLMSSVPTAANAGYYAIIVRERAILRRLVEAGTRITQMGYGSDGADLDEIVNRAQQEIHGVTGRRSHEGAPLADIMESTLDEIESISNRSGQTVGVPTGFADLDALTQGLHRRQMTVIGSRSAVGKSTLALDLLRSAAVRNGLPSALFTTESTANEINMRLLSAEARVALHHMRAGTMTDDDWARMASRMGEVSAAPLFIHDKDHMTVAYVEQQCRTLVSRHGLRLAVIDSIHGLMYGTRPFQNRYLEVSEISRHLKQLAKELDIAVVAVATLNRNWQTQRQDWQWNRPPTLSDLRDSGTLEDDADVVILVHREDLYERESPRAGEADLIVAKHRHGPTAMITTAFQGHYSRFVDMAAEPPTVPASLIDVANSDEANRPVENIAGLPDVLPAPWQSLEREPPAMPVTIYVSDESVHAQVEAAVDELLATVDLEIDEREDPVFGSWFRRMLARGKGAVVSQPIREAAMTAAHAAEARLVLGMDAAIAAKFMENLGPLIASLQPTKDAVIRLGAVLILKIDGVVTVHQLSPAQQFQLDHQPELPTAPHALIESLRLAQSKPISVEKIIQADEASPGNHIP